MKENTWFKRLASIFLIAGTLAGVAIAVGDVGSQANPLVTLDYLNKVVEELTAAVDEKINAKADEMLGQMGGAGSTFAAVTVEDGMDLYLASGSQVILRSGTASSTGGILDATAGEIVSGGMKENRIYIAMGEDHKLSVTGTVVFLVLGGYTIR